MHNHPHQSLSYCEATNICVGPILSYLIPLSQELTSSLVSCWIGTPSISRPVHTLLWSTVFGWLKNDLICVWEWQGNCPHTPPSVCDPLNPRARGDTHISRSCSPVWCSNTATWHISLFHFNSIIPPANFIWPQHLLSAVFQSARALHIL